MHGSGGSRPDAGARHANGSLAGHLRLLDGHAVHAESGDDFHLLRRSHRETRAFFTSFVSGRGPLPAIRIGGQPYGILPSRRSRAFSGSDRTTGFRRAVSLFLGAFYNLLRKIDADWTKMSQSVAWVGKAGDPHQTLLDILALHPSSVEYFSRNAESLDLLFNMVNRFALGPAWLNALTSEILQATAIALLAASRLQRTSFPIC